MNTQTLSMPPAPPSWTLLSSEPIRAALEYATMRLTKHQAERSGDGHPVVIFPGLGADARSIAPMREFCEQIGFSAHEWGRGINTGPKGDVDAWLHDLARHVEQLATPGERISLIGWSLGGIYAREVAKLLGDRARQVITIGTPFAGSPNSTNVGLIYRLLNGQKPMLDSAMTRRLATPPNVPTTSVYSRSDGVVAWQACIQAGSDKNLQNIEVQGSHCGLGWNRDVFSIVADRLHQPVGKWRPYRGPAPKAGLVRGWLQGEA